MTGAGLPRSSRCAKLAASSPAAAAVSGSNSGSGLARIPACDPRWESGRPMLHSFARSGLIVAILALLVSVTPAMADQNVPGGSGASATVLGPSAQPPEAGARPSEAAAGINVPTLSLGASRPDIVFLLLDDLPQMDNRLWERLPTIRHLFLDTGVAFTDYIGNDPLCCPGRANLLSGQWSHHHGVIFNDARLFDSRESIATELQAAGYWTGIFGKYFNKTEKLADKSPLGWDRSFIFSGSYWNMNTYTDGVYHKTTLATADYSTSLVGNHALSALKTAPLNKPRFVWLAPFAAHAGKDQTGKQWMVPVPRPNDVGDPRCTGLSDWSTPANTESDMSDKPLYLQPRALIPSWPMTRYCEAFLSVDRILAKVLAEFKAEGRPEPMVIMTADNGMDFGAHRWATKFVPYSTPLPLFVHWPARIGSVPGVVTTTVTNVDFAPTICAIAGCFMGPYPNGFGVDGISFLPALLARGGSLGRLVVFEEHNSDIDGDNMPPWEGLRTTAESGLGRYVYTVYQTGEKELYDISGGPCWSWHEGMPGDPCELTNLAGDPGHADIEALLAALLARRDDSGGRPRT
jgi:N-acetylglucosamine-6-sulfatase